MKKLIIILAATLLMAVSAHGAEAFVPGLRPYRASKLLALYYINKTLIPPGKNPEIVWHIPNQSRVEVLVRDPRDPLHIYKLVYKFSPHENGCRVHVFYTRDDVTLGVEYLYEPEAKQAADMLPPNLADLAKADDMLNESRY
jgi:hypothetical protein